MPSEQTLSFEESQKRSRQIEAEMAVHPQRFRVVTGDRPTGPLHIGHLLGSINNRVRLQNLGVDLFIVIADYQVLTDRTSVDQIQSSVHEIVLDYLTCGIDPSRPNVHIFCHSQVLALNQLLLPFLSLVTMSELDRNPTVKEEIQAAKLRSVNALMYTYPVHQAADILAFKANLVPVGKDQLPHLELTRKIANRFNERYCAPPLFPAPEALLSETPTILGLDGDQKMSKSRNNAVFIKSSEDESVALIRKAKTDSIPFISYERQQRPEVANLLELCGSFTGKPPEQIASELAGKGSSGLKKYLTDALNEYLKPIRKRRQEFEEDRGIVSKVLRDGIKHASAVAEATLSEVHHCMKMAVDS